MMAQVKFNKNYQDYELKKEVKAGEVVEMTLKRADEIVNDIRQQAQKFPRFNDYKDFSYERVDMPDETNDTANSEEKDAEPAKETKVKKAKDKE